MILTRELGVPVVSYVEFNPRADIWRIFQLIVGKSDVGGNVTSKGKNKNKKELQT